MVEGPIRLPVSPRRSQTRLDGLVMDYYCYHWQGESTVGARYVITFCCSIWSSLIISEAPTPPCHTIVWTFPYFQPATHFCSRCRLFIKHLLGRKENTE